MTNEGKPKNIRKKTDNEKYPVIEDTTSSTRKPERPYYSPWGFFEQNPATSDMEKMENANEHYRKFYDHLRQFQEQQLEMLKQFQEQNKEMLSQSQEQNKDMLPYQWVQHVGFPFPRPENDSSKDPDAKETARKANQAETKTASYPYFPPFANPFYPMPPADNFSDKQKKE